MSSLFEREETLCNRQSAAKCKRRKKCWRYQNPNRDGWEAHYYPEFGEFCDGFTPLPKTDKNPEKIKEDARDMLSEIRKGVKD